MCSPKSMPFKNKADRIAYHKNAREAIRLDPVAAEANRIQACERKRKERLLKKARDKMNVTPKKFSEMEPAEQLMALYSNHSSARKERHQVEANAATARYKIDADAEAYEVKELAQFLSPLRAPVEQGHDNEEAEEEEFEDAQEFKSETEESEDESVVMEKVKKPKARRVVYESKSDESVESMTPRPSSGKKSTTFKKSATPVKKSATPAKETNTQKRARIKAQHLRERTAKK